MNFKNICCCQSFIVEGQTFDKSQRQQRDNPDS
jgi:hypothetical protein